MGVGVRVRVRVRVRARVRARARVRFKVTEHERQGVVTIATWPPVAFGAFPASSHKPLKAPCHSNNPVL